MKRVSVAVLCLGILFSIAACSAEPNDDTDNYQIGYDDGYDDGYEAGYNDGFDTGIEENTIDTPSPSPSSTPSATNSPDNNEIETVPSVSTSSIDFFLDEERQTKYKELYTSYKYSELLQYLNTYIEEYSPDEGDSVFSVLQYVEPAADIIQKCTIVYDDFDDKYTANYDNITSINSNTCVVSTVSGTDIKVILGFVRSDWLFFDTATIKFSDDLKSTFRPNDSDIERVVINGGIMESTRYSLSYDDTVMFANADVITIRFENSETDTVFDHTLTVDEKNAVVAMGILYSAYRNCSDLQFHWNQEH